MKPGFVSDKFLRLVILKSLLIKLILQIASPKGIHQRVQTWLVCIGEDTPFQIHSISQQIKDRFLRTKLQFAGAACDRARRPNPLLPGSSEVTFQRQNLTILFFSRTGIN